MVLDGWVDGWMDEWVDGWMDGRAGLRIAYRNQKKPIQPTSSIFLHSGTFFCRVVHFWDLSSNLNTTFILLSTFSHFFQNFAHLTKRSHLLLLNLFESQYKIYCF